MVLSYEVWQSQFNGDPGIVNKAVHMNGRPFVVIGVMPAGFRFPLNIRNAVYTPLHIDQPWMQNRGAHWLRTVARVRDGVSLTQAQADITRVFGQLGKTYPQTDEGRTVSLLPLADSINSKSKGPLWTLFAAVLAVLAIGCVNVAGLLLARGVKRQHEMAMRVAIGAGRLRLLRQLLTEGLILALLGAAAGSALAWSLLSSMRSFLVHALARGADIHLDWAVLSAGVGISLVASLAASIYPALRLSGVDPNTALKAGGSAGTQRGQHRLRSTFVITQVALTLVLLVVAGLLLRVVSRYRHTNLGFDPSHILAEKINLSRIRYEGRDILGEFYQPFEQRIAQLPGVQAVGFINILPIENWGSNSEIHIAGQPPYPPNQEMLAEGRMVSAGYFKVMGIPLHQGRLLSASHERPENKSNAVVVNDAFVKKFIPAGLDPTSQRIDDADKQEEWTRIIGVVGNIRQDIYQEPMAERDWLMDGVELKARTDNFANMTLLVRTAGDPVQIAPALRSIMHDLDPTAAFETPEVMTDVVSDTLVFERMESWLFSIFAGLALLLAMVGLYGLMSQEVEQGRREIGVRMALGATRSRIVRMVLARVSWMLAVGCLTGLILTMGTQKLIGSVIYFDASREAGGLLMMASLLMGIGMIAALIPATRASSTEPVRALRSE